MKQFKLTLLFLFLNFGGLALGNFFMANAVQDEWYRNLIKAPWTPPGWVFGFAWTTIMISFSIYLGKLLTIETNTKFLIPVFFTEFILNSSWNFIFFNQHYVLFALIVIILLTFLLFFYFLKLSKKVGYYKFLLVPYMIWLSIATSLNLYILIHN
jgi:tryptophan-rich sensory protein